MKRKYIRNKNFCIGLGIVVFLFVMMFISLFYTPYPPDAMDTANAFAVPSAKHLLGTDNFWERYFKSLDDRITDCIFLLE